MNINFVLPGSSPTPTGGVKIIYEHANRLVARGHGVTILHGAYVTRKSGLQRMAKGAASYLLNQAGIMRWRPDRWFQVNPRIRMLWAPNLSGCWLPDGDAVIATSWQVAEWVREYPDTKGKKFYFAQDFERFMEAGAKLRERISSLYSAGLHTLVQSPAGQNMVETISGATPWLVPCALEFGVYNLQSPLDADSRTMIGFPARPERHKAMGDAVEALVKMRERTGFTATVWSFGGARPDKLPEWIEHHPFSTDAQLAALYNRTKIFVVPSLYEGWGLPGSEAMACGAALVSTDNGGVRAYAEQGKSALLTPPGKPELLGGAISLLLEDEAYRLKIARTGYEHIRQFTWERASGDLERCLEQALSRGLA